MYSVGDYVVKVNDGICRVEEITHLQMSGISSDKLYYLLIPLYNKGSRIYMPVEGREGELRNVITSKQVEEIFTRLPSVNVEWADNNKLREQKYKEAIKDNDVEELTRYIKCIYKKRHEREMTGKKNTALDERYLRMLEDVVYSEMAFAMGCERMDVKDKVLAAIK